MGTRTDPGYLRGVSIDGAERPGIPSMVTTIYPAGCADLGPDASPDQVMACMEPQLSVWDHVRVRAATLTPIQAMEGAVLYLVDGDAREVEEPMAADGEWIEGTVEQIGEGFVLADAVEALVAAAHTVTIPDVPPMAWFTEPTDAPEFGAIEMHDDGRFFGYVAPVGASHRSYAGSGREVRTPMGNVDYGLWANRARVVELPDGTTTKIATGAITLDCGHASTTGPQARSSQIALAHYDNACSLFATACIGENKRGVWIAGALLPGVTPAQIARAMACQLSGDWRPHSQGRKGWREFAGCLLVPVPGLPMASTQGARFSEQVDRDGLALVASSVPVVFASDVDCEPCALAASAAQIDDDGTANAARAIAKSVGYDRADHARRIYQSVKG